MPHWNFSLHARSRAKYNPNFKKPVFEPRTQTELLRLSENIFVSCS